MTRQAGHPLAMLTKIYIEALPVDQELADQVWEAWDTGPAQRPINSVESRADGQPIPDPSFRPWQPVYE